MKSRREMIIQAIDWAFKEDLGDGDHSSLACIPIKSKNKAHLIAKEIGVIAGVEIANIIFNEYGTFDFKKFFNDGQKINTGDIIFEVQGLSQEILACERLVLNVMQRMSGISTYTSHLNDLIEGTPSKLLDTRKTTPNFRVFEREAVRIGGGENHRFALYDMIILKDNHIDYSGGVSVALEKTKAYLKSINRDLKIEIEVRNFKELEEALHVGGFHRIMFDNFSPSATRDAIKMVNGKYETESSGMITEETIRDYALTGVDYISVGALTHQVKSLDLSLKAI
tara:strand:- start:6519 stop:7364 length:846 start_codon:yes stop_codon:yes gene_type:complete